jgi:phenylalanyl-tRNA synthetase beta chain
VLDELGLEVKGIEQGAGDRTILTIETLANRGDHVATLGIAREISARFLTAIKTPSVAATLGEKKAGVGVRINTPLCLRYGLMELSVPAEMPLRPDVAQFLGEPDPARAAVVHLTNYILLELGQPMHAFDREKIDGEIVVDATTGEETIEALDGKSYQLPKGSVVIRDRKKIVAVAGIIGCANSMVTPSTTRTLIECATFDPVSVRMTARAMGISTDAKHAFERGTDVEMVSTALKRFLFLAEGSGGAVKDGAGAHLIGATVIDGMLPERRKLKLSLARVREHLNAPRLAEGEIVGRLKYLGFGLELLEKEKFYSITVPSWRYWDMKNDQDLIEEVARVHGLSKVRLELPSLSAEAPELAASEQLLAAVEPPLLGLGFSELISKVFYSGEVVKMLGELDPAAPTRHIAVKNSLEGAYSHLRTTGLVALARVADENLRRGVLSVKGYEYGRTFTAVPRVDAPYEFEQEFLTLVQAGRWYEDEWRKPESLEERLVLFRGAIQSVVRSLGLDFSVTESDHRLLHPGMQAGIKAGRSICGVFGVVHPHLRDSLDLRTEVLYAELDTELLVRLSRDREFRAPCDFPAIRRDLTLQLPLRELATRIVRIIEEQKPAGLTAVAMVDNFRKVEEPFRRTSFRLTFQSPERTLEHGEVDAAMQTILSALRERGYQLAG